jgi:hypothetical protein
MAVQAEAERLNNLRSMAERDPEREGEAFPMGRAKLRRTHARRGTDAIGMHATVGKSDTHTGDGLECDLTPQRFYASMRASDMPRGPQSVSTMLPQYHRTVAELKANPLGSGPRLRNLG